MKIRERLKLYAFVFLICLNTLGHKKVFGADSNGTVKSININKIIKGELTDITISVNSIWQKNISMEFETSESETSFTEKYYFYYKPIDDTLDKFCFMELGIYKNNIWNKQDEMRKITSSYDYTAAVKLNENPLSFSSDKVILDNMIKDANNDLFLKNMIGFEGSTVSSSTVYINGKALETAAYASTNTSVVYVPIRQACEKLGYTVSWIQKGQRIIITGDSFYNELTLDGRINKKYHVISRGGISYVSSAYFLQVLKCNVEIDSKNNVKIFD